MIIYIGITLMLILAGVEASTFNRFAIQKRFQGNNESVFALSLSLGSEYDSLQLSEGAPDYKPPETLTNALINATLGHYSLSQYSPNFGIPRMKKAVAKFYSRLLNRNLDQDDNVLITVGATEALYAAFQTLTSPGDEWIVFQPFYTAYEPMIKASFGVPKFVTLRTYKYNGNLSSRDWTFDRIELSRAFNKRTKGILLNNPHNPTGKVFTRKELEFIANLAKKWNTLVISDEVYQFLIYDQNEHISIATIPGMWERTLTVGSGGKAFSATGLRIGWAISNSNIMDNLKAIHEHIVVNAPTSTQEAFAVQFENEYDNFGTPKSYLHEFLKAGERKRNHLVKTLTDFGLVVTVPESGYYMIANWTAFADSINLEKDANMDIIFVKWLSKNVRVLGLPTSAFYSKFNRIDKQGSIRFAFIKTDETLEEANYRFRNWSKHNKLRN